ncbi:hypothetical protein B484DRAFT_444186 [Ochromonadaceae sp. CCMP2298]|nr:hypothetical protein B484DRAFT_444186 [Ochromonadaceae sp. CCMP2298]
MYIHIPIYVSALYTPSSVSPLCMCVLKPLYMCIKPTICICMPSSVHAVQFLTLYLNPLSLNPLSLNPLSSPS